MPALVLCLMFAWYQLLRLTGLQSGDEWVGVCGLVGRWTGEKRILVGGWVLGQAGGRFRWVGGWVGEVKMLPGLVRDIGGLVGGW